MDDDADLADAWARLMALFFSSRDSFFAELGRLQLTPPHGFAMLTLLHSGPIRMSDMAAAMVCDASYITAVADRLEELGFAERRTASGDRRAKELVLTDEGRSVATRLDAVFTGPPPALRELGRTDRQALVRTARKLGPPSKAPWQTGLERPAED